MDMIKTDETLRLIDEKEVAEFLGVSRYSLQAWRVRGFGPTFVSVGRLVRYRRADVVAWLDSRTRASTSQALD